MEGFQRSLALTSHLVLNGEIITQAPSLKGASVFVRPPRAGSFEIAAIIAAGAGAVYKLGTADRNTPLGHLVHSVYDYVVKSTLGIRVNYEESLGQSIEISRKRGDSIAPPTQSKIDSLAEKIEPSLIKMHRPIVKSETASIGKVSHFTKEKPLTIADLSVETYGYVAFNEPADLPERFIGRVSSFNINTFRGRIFISNEERPIPFELVNVARSDDNVRLVGRSLAFNSGMSDERGLIEFLGFRNDSRTGRLKKIDVLDVAPT
jgi:hypothetical protein